MRDVRHQLRAAPFAVLHRHRHAVEGIGQLGQLVVAGRHADTYASLTLRDSLCGIGGIADRSNQPQGQKDAQREHDGRGDYEGSAEGHGNLPRPGVAVAVAADQVGLEGECDHDECGCAGQQHERLAEQKLARQPTEGEARHPSPIR